MVAFAPKTETRCDNEKGAGAAARAQRISRSLCERRLAGARRAVQENGRRGATILREGPWRQKGTQHGCLIKGFFGGVLADDVAKIRARRARIKAHRLQIPQRNLARHRTASARRRARRRRREWLERARREAMARHGFALLVHRSGAQRGNRLFATCGHRVQSDAKRVAVLVATASRCGGQQHVQERARLHHFFQTCQRRMAR